VRHAEIITKIGSMIDREADRADPVRAAAVAVSALARDGHLPEIISVIRGDQELLARSASASHRHPLGHDKIMLFNVDHSFQLRLHAWWPCRPPVVESVHHHRFRFATTVLRGGYEMQTFRRASSGIRMIEYRQHASPDGGTWLLDLAGTTYLELTAARKVGTGSSYGLTAADLHRVIIPGDKLCITLFLAVTADSDMSSDTRVYALPDADPPVRMASRPMTEAGYLQLLDAVTAELT
jgi:hypothetical protein